MPRLPKYEKLKEDSNLKLWFDNHSKQITAKGDLRRLGLFCELFSVTPQDIVKLAQPPASPLDAKKWIIGKVAILQDEKHGFKGNYVANFVKSLVSWFGHNGITLPEKPEIHIKGRGKNRKFRGEEPPSPDELQQLLDVISDIRQKVTISLIAFSGLRPRTLGNHDGSDGLRIRDLPEMHIDYKERKVTF